MGGHRRAARRSGLSRADDLQVVGADINPRVVEHLDAARAAPPVLTLVSEIAESDTIKLSAEYRDYFAQLGGAIGTVVPAPSESRAALRPFSEDRAGRCRAASALSAAAVDIVTEHLDVPAFDLIIATNILPYFDDVQLMLAMGNVSRMLAPGGVFLHNEARPILGEITEALGLEFEQSRQVVIATVRGAAPLADSVWIHRRVTGK